MEFNLNWLVCLCGSSNTGDIKQVRHDFHTDDNKLEQMQLKTWTDNTL